MKRYELIEVMKSVLEWAERTKQTPGGTRYALSNVFPSYKCMVYARKNEATIKGWSTDEFIEINLPFRKVR